jgi:hypothetical protein
MITPAKSESSCPRITRKLPKAELTHPTKTSSTGSSIWSVGESAMPLPTHSTRSSRFGIERPWHDTATRCCKTSKRIVFA